MYWLLSEKSDVSNDLLLVNAQQSTHNSMFQFFYRENDRLSATR